MAGFECSTHRNVARERLDVIAATRHDKLAAADYAQLTELGLGTARDGVRWHLIETRPRHYDWSAVLPLMRAAERAGVQVIWDLLHYGWPDDLDVFSAAFVDRFAAYAENFARLHVEVIGRPPFVCPVNEMSFLAWGGGDMARMSPHTAGRGGELKRQLVRTAIAGTLAVRAAAPGARFATIDPIIHIVPRHGEPPEPVEAHNEGQWEAWDMLTGRLEPGLGGRPELLDVLGVNYYWNNQWIDHTGPLSPFDMRYRPLPELLAVAHARYRRPIFVAETSIEGALRPDWLAYVSREVRRAIDGGVPVEGICWYPILSHLGWDEPRYCANGLLELAAGNERPINQPLLQELRRQQQLMKSIAPG